MSKHSFYQRTHLYLLVSMFFLSPGVWNEWLRWDDNSFYLTFFLRMAPIIWQKILKGRFLKKVKEILTAFSEILLMECGSNWFFSILQGSRFGTLSFFFFFCRQKTTPSAKRYIPFHLCRLVNLSPSSICLAGFCQKRQRQPYMLAFWHSTTLSLKPLLQLA